MLFTYCIILCTLVRLALLFIKDNLTWLERGKFSLTFRLSKGKKGRGRYSSSWEPHLRATGRHLPYGITQCYLPPDTSERAPPNPSHAGWYSIYLPRRDGRLSWPSWLDSAPAGDRTSDLSITSPTPNTGSHVGYVVPEWDLARTLENSEHHGLTS